MATNEDWTRGYAKQAAADFATYNALQGNSAIPQCHKLQFLQMACEKLVKAHLIKGGTAPGNLQSSHAYVAGTLPVVIRQRITLSGVAVHNSQWIMEHARLLAAEIDLLAPAVKLAGAPGRIIASTPGRRRGKPAHPPRMGQFQARKAPACQGGPDLSEACP